MAIVTGFDLDAITVGVNGVTTYTEGESRTRIAANATVAATGNFNGQSLRISGLLPEDALGFANGVSIVGNSIRIGGVTVGTFSGGSGGTHFLITFNSNATAARFRLSFGT